MKNLRVIVTGTDPKTARGGIGVVMPGYLRALEHAGLAYECVPTYRPGNIGGKWRPLLVALPVLHRRIVEIRKQHTTPLIYSHAGAGLSLARESVVLRLGRKLGARTVLQVHAPEVDRYLTAKWSSSLLTWAVMPAEKVCLLTPWWRARLEQIRSGATLTVVPNPMPPDLEAIANREHRRAAHPSGRVTLLAMARLVPGKGVDVAIRALAHLPEYVRLVVGGDGSARGVLESLAREMGVGRRVRFVGWVSGEEKARLLTEADVFCLPSTYDAFPMSMVEAMAYGLPVVAVRWGGIPDVVPHGRAGFLADQAVPEEVARAVRPLLDPQARSTVGAQAQEWIRKLSAPEAVGQRLRSIFEQLTSE